MSTGIFLDLVAVPSSWAMSNASNSGCSTNTLYPLQKSGKFSPEIDKCKMTEWKYNYEVNKWIIFVEYQQCQEEDFESTPNTLVATQLS